MKALYAVIVLITIVNLISAMNLGTTVFGTPLPWPAFYVGANIFCGGVFAILFFRS